MGDYLCQVTSTDRTEEITIRVGCEYFIISFCTVNILIFKGVVDCDFTFLTLVSV